MSQGDRTPSYLFKIVVVGESGVGKSNLVHQFVQNVFNEQLNPTLGVELESLVVPTHNGKFAKMQFWDTAGQEKMRTITHSYYHDAHGAILVYDVADKSTIERIPYWMKQVRDRTGENVKCMLLGNKIDKVDERQVTKEQGEAIATKWGALFFEVSAKTNQDNCVNKAMEALVKEMVDVVTPTAQATMEKKLGIVEKTKLRVSDRLSSEKTGNSCCLRKS